MIDDIKVKVLWDGDEVWPFYDFNIVIKLNDPTINEDNIYDKGFDPHYLYDHHLEPLLKFLGFNRNNATIAQVYLKVYNGEGKEIFYIELI